MSDVAHVCIHAGRSGDTCAKCGLPAAADRILIVGQTQSGKSTLARPIANAWDRVLVIDSKGDPAEAAMPNAHVTGDHRDAIRHLPGRVVYQPARAEMVDHRRKVNEIVERIWQLGGAHAIVIHELADAADETKATVLEAPALLELWRKGAFFGIPVVAISQRPRQIPLVARTESTHYFCFALVNPDDRDTMAGYMGEDVKAPLPIPFDRSFWHRGPNGVLTLSRGGAA